MDLTIEHVNEGGLIEYDRLNPGERTGHEPCDAAEGYCFGATGGFWLADGVGLCSPSTWTSWTRVRTIGGGDGLCWQFGGNVQIGLMQDGGLDFEDRSDVDFRARVILGAELIGDAKINIFD